MGAVKTNFIIETDFLKDKAIAAVFKKKVREYIEVLSKDERLNYSTISFLFCNDSKIREYNKTYLSHDYETDILTFFDTDEDGNAESDIIISTDMVEYNAYRFKKSFSEELFRVILHGLLHLCGYDDKDKKNKLIMTAKEDEYLEKVGYVNLFR